MENTANHITLTGTLASLPEYSHQNHERRFFRFLLAVERLSGTEDLLPVLAAEDVLEQAELFEGERFTIEGQIRSFNNREPTGRRLILCVYALSMTTTDAPMQNEAVLTGTVCKPPVYRQTPLGRQITDLCLAVPRLYRRTDYIPSRTSARRARRAPRMNSPSAPVSASRNLQFFRENPPSCATTGQKIRLLSTDDSIDKRYRQKLR